jgi:hypothetical protein
LGDVIKNMTEREEALGESTKFAPPAVRSNRIAQTSRTTAGDRFLAGGSPVQIWVARITAKWDKNNRTAWEALSLNKLLSGSVFRRGLPLPHEIRMKAIIPAQVFVADRIKIGRLTMRRPVHAGL